VYQDASRILSRHVTRHTSPALGAQLRRFLLGTATVRPAPPPEPPGETLQEIWLEWGGVHAPARLSDHADSSRR
jgi:hypothetical protein